MSSKKNTKTTKTTKTASSAATDLPAAALVSLPSAGPALPSSLPTVKILVKGEVLEVEDGTRPQVLTSSPRKVKLSPPRKASVGTASIFDPEAQAPSRVVGMVPTAVREKIAADMARRTARAPKAPAARGYTTAETLTHLVVIGLIMGGGVGVGYAAYCLFCALQAFVLGL